MRMSDSGKIRLHMIAHFAKRFEKCAGCFCQPQHPRFFACFHPKNIFLLDRGTSNVGNFFLPSHCGSHKLIKL